MLIRNLIGGQFVESRFGSMIDDLNPSTQEIISRVPLTIAAAKSSFPKWRNTPVTTRQNVMLKLQKLIRRDMDKLALNITTEQGKTLKDAQGDGLRGLRMVLTLLMMIWLSCEGCFHLAEIVEHACGMGKLQMGEYVSNVVHGIDTYSIREPWGVCAGICSFNFPATTPLWMFPVAVTYGNTFILKPSEKDPDCLFSLQWVEAASYGSWLPKLLPSVL